MFLPLYLDAGLGALIAQAAIAGFAGFVLFYKTVIATVKGWLGMRKAKRENSFDKAYDQTSQEKS